MSILPKKQMSEEDIKLQYITPAIQSKGWRDHITMETAIRFTDGKISLRGNFVHREQPKKADYVLYINTNNPIAIVEAKDDKSTITSHEVYFSLYQQLVGDDDQEHFSELFTPDFFDLVIVEVRRRKAVGVVSWNTSQAQHKSA